MGSTEVIAALLISIAAAFYGDFLVVVVGKQLKRAIIEAFYMLIGGPHKAKNVL